MTRHDTAEYVTFAPEAFTEQGRLTPAMRDYLASLLAWETQDTAELCDICDGIPNVAPFGCDRCAKREG